MNADLDMMEWEHWTQWGLIDSAEDLLAAALITLVLLPLVHATRGLRAGRLLQAPSGWFGLVWSAMHRLGQQEHGRGMKPMFKMAVFCLTHARLASHWLRFLQRPELRTLVASQPRLLDKIQRPYLNRHWRPAQRARALVTHYEWMFSQLQLRTIIDLYAGRPLLLARLTGRGGVQVTSLWLEHASHQEREGELALTLRSSLAAHVAHEHPEGAGPRGTLMATLVFSITEEHGHLHLGIGCVQGSQLAGLSAFRELTKSMHGLRPKAMLVWAAQLCAQHWGVSVRGIAAHAHPFTSLRYRVSRRKRATLRHIGDSYHPLWDESGGVAHPGGWYTLPDRPRIKTREEVASDKRSLYERRGAMQHDLQAQMSATLDGIRQHA